MNRNHGFLFPGALANIILQAAHVFFQPQRHLFDIFPLGIAQQTPQVNLASLPLFGALKGRCKQLHITRHFIYKLYKLFDILLRQIALWRRTSFSYNSHGHGFLDLLSTGRWSEKDTMLLHFWIFGQISRDLAL